ncbi:hypothetical protein HDE_00238 [Halotydeus destructor]|nr:hypothetical protein HDE_00238 [Halotydeus destructor]
MPVPKSATAPPTPSNSCPPSPAQSYPGVKSKSSKKKIATVKERDDVSLDIKRKKLWLLIVRNYVPKRALQVLSTKQEAIFQCRKLASWCEDAVENGPPLMKKEFRELMQNSVREAEHLVCDLERSASVGKFKEMLFYWPQLW